MFAKPSSATEREWTPCYQQCDCDSRNYYSFEVSHVVLLGTSLGWLFFTPYWHHAVSVRFVCDKCGTKFVKTFELSDAGKQARLGSYKRVDRVVNCLRIRRPFDVIQKAFDAAEVTMKCGTEQLAKSVLQAIIDPVQVKPMMVEVNKNGSGTSTNLDFSRRNKNSAVNEPTSVEGCASGTINETSPAPVACDGAEAKKVEQEMEQLRKDIEEAIGNPPVPTCSDREMTKQEVSQMEVKAYDDDVEKEMEQLRIELAGEIQQL